MSRPEIFDWSDCAVTKLRLWWAEGASASEIARRFGPPCTKNAVLGKAHRLKLPMRAPSVNFGGAAAVQRVRAKQSARARTPVPSPTQEAKKVVLTLVPTPEPEPCAAAPVATPEPPQTRFLPRKATDCCWPIGEPRTPGFRFCDAVAIAGKPYCQEHYAIAYRPYRPKAEHLADQVAAGVEIANRRGPIRMRAALPR